MKSVKIVMMVIAIGALGFFMFRKSGSIDLQGNWKATKVVLNGKDVLAADPLHEFFDMGNEVVVSHWGDSIHISTIGETKISARFVIQDRDRGTKQIVLSSREQSLNGVFHLDIDTTHIGPQAYIVHVKISANATTLNFQKNVSVPPWKPEFPRKGQM